NLINHVKPLAEFDIKTLEDLDSMGIKLGEVDGHIHLLTKDVPIDAQKFCIVDIETNGCSLQDGHIIEIGAVMFQNGEIIGEFNSLIHFQNLSEIIIGLTGITDEMLKTAPSEISVLEKFRLFLRDAVFVAHNVEFDFWFISNAYTKNNLPPLLNRRLCTIDLARKTIEAPKYGLSFLREMLNITEGGVHRGLWDAKSAAVVFEQSLRNLPEEIKTTEELISFSKFNQKKKKIKEQKKLPFTEEEKA
ncbi:MAG: 3'-5' exonuclease, partial [Campylobacteraceae bacterium]